MDPITHTFTGGALAAAGLRKTTPLAAPTLALAANAPDIDVLSYAGGEYAALAFRRGWTHGPLALILLPFLVAGAVLAYDRWIRRRRHPDRAPARAAPLVLVALIGVATHPALDWLNTYGLRWLMPFDGRWFYGDALFIVDPWVWLGLGGALFLVRSRTAPGLAAWAAFGALATYLVAATPFVPGAAKAVWLCGVAALVIARAHGIAAGRGDERGERIARWGLVAAAAYIALMIGADLAARRIVRATLAASAIGPIEELMVAPEPGNPFVGSIVVATPAAYRQGSFHWLRRPRVRMDAGGIARSPSGPIIEAAVRAPEARDFLTWSRFPFFRVEESAGGYTVRIGDARYPEAAGMGGLGGVTVRLGPTLVSAEERK